MRIRLITAASSLGAVVLASTAAHAARFGTIAAPTGGGAANVCVVMEDGNNEIAGVQMDLQWDPNCMSSAAGSGKPKCRSNPETGKTVQSAMQPNGALRAIMVSFSDVEPIPDGQLFCCEFQLGAGAPADGCPVTISNLIGSSSGGEKRPVQAIPPRGVGVVPAPPAYGGGYGGGGADNGGGDAGGGDTGGGSGDSPWVRGGDGRGGSNANSGSGNAQAAGGGSGTTNSGSGTTGGSGSSGGGPVGVAPGSVGGGQPSGAAAGATGGNAPQGGGGYGSGAQGGADTAGQADDDAPTRGLAEGSAPGATGAKAAATPSPATTAAAAVNTPTTKPVATPTKAAVPTATQSSSGGWGCSLPPRSAR